LQRERFVPVLLGPRLPRGDCSAEEKEQLSRMLLILFKPWRVLQDLKSMNETWTEAYQRQEFPALLKRIICNIHVEHECRDARERIDKERHTD
ncbi:hypothetical protein BV25DRAFT_1778848, partial [Artomyces pyxidatus]